MDRRSALKRIAAGGAAAAAIVAVDRQVAFAAGSVIGGTLNATMGTYNDETKERVLQASIVAPTCTGAPAPTPAYEYRWVVGGFVVGDEATYTIDVTDAQMVTLRVRVSCTGPEKECATVTAEVTSGAAENAAFTGTAVGFTPGACSGFPA